MDWITITTNCFATSNAIAKASLLLHGFLRDVRESRAEIDPLLGELQSLDTILDLLKDDAASFPPDLARLTPVLLDNCAILADEIGSSITSFSGHTLPVKEKRWKWLANRKELAVLGLALQGYKGVLGAAVDLVGVATALRPEAHDSPARYHINEAPEILIPTSIGKDVRANPVVKAYLIAIQAHADSYGILFTKPDQRKRYGSDASDESGDAPDSAIEMFEPPAGPPPSSPYSTGFPNPSIDEVEEYESYLNLASPPEPSEPPPPPPPPKAFGRSASSQRSATPTRPPPLLRPNTAKPDYTYGLRPDSGLGPVPDSPLQVPRRTTSLRLADVALFAARDEPMRPSTTVTRIDSDADSLRPRGVGRFFGHVRNKLSNSTLAESQPHPDAWPTTMTVITSNSDRSSLRRSTSKRLSAAIKLLPAPPKTAAPVPPPEPDNVFGVSLSKSMQIASSAARTHHGGDSKGASRRDFPLCLLKCATYLRHEGLDTPDIFGSHVDEDLVAALQTIFSTGPDYGEDMELHVFGPRAAAELIVQYLSLLPKPLVPEGVARRWVKLSRQATVAGLASSRFDECIDFWEEALGGMKGPSRNVLKLLLNLWGDVADHAQQNEMTAERLAGSLVKPLLHTPPGNYYTDLMLGLAFIIRKRSEYSMLLQGEGRRSNAAFRA